MNAPRQAPLRELTLSRISSVTEHCDIVTFERIYRLHSRKVRKLHVRIVGAPATAEDPTQIRQHSYDVLDLQVEASLSCLAT